jgi:hypothetical protein
MLPDLTRSPRSRCPDLGVHHRAESAHDHTTSRNGRPGDTRREHIELAEDRPPAPRATAGNWAPANVPCDNLVVVRVHPRRPRARSFTSGPFSCGDPADRPQPTCRGPTTRRGRPAPNPPDPGARLHAELEDVAEGGGRRGHTRDGSRFAPGAHHRVDRLTHDRAALRRSRAAAGHGAIGGRQRPWHNGGSRCASRPSPPQLRLPRVSRRAAGRARDAGGGARCGRPRWKYCITRFGRLYRHSVDAGPLNEHWRFKEQYGSGA